MTFAWVTGKGTGAWTMFELTTMAHRFSEALERTEPRHRGRSWWGTLGKTCKQRWSWPAEFRGFNV